MSYQCLKLSGQGWASIADAPEQGLNMGLSDFMIEGYIKANPLGTGTQHIVCKRAGSVYYWTRLTAAGVLLSEIYDGVNWAESTGTTDLRDGRWHYFVLAVDRSSATGMQLYLGGSAHGASGNPTAVGSVNNAGLFTIGSDYTGNNRFNSLFDEARIWNFGFGGLPDDVATYIAWRAAGRNRFLDISAFDGGAWNGYADAYRVERLTLGALDDDNSDFEGVGADGTDIEVGTDWGKSNTSAEIDNEAGSGVNSYNGSDFCAKIHTGSGDYPRINLLNADIFAAFDLGEWYEIKYDYKVLNCTSAWMSVRRDSGGVALAGKNLTSTSWTTDRFIFQVTTDSNVGVRVYSHNGTDEDGTEVVWVDNISIKRIGLVARYKFDGNLLDSGGSNNNDLTEGGSGNSFPGYSLRSKAQKMLLGVG